MASVGVATDKVRAAALYLPAQQGFRGPVCFAWYRITVTLPERVGDLPLQGSTVVFEVVVDD